MDAIDTFAVIMQLMNILVLIPIILYFSYQFYLHKDEPIMKHRDITLVYTINLITLFCLLVERFYVCLVCIWNVIDLPIWTVHGFIAFSWWAGMDLFAIKVYILYFQQQYNRCICDIAWQKDINPNINYWYITNKKKYGNVFYLIKLSFIPYIITALIESIVPYFSGPKFVFFLVHSILASIPVSIAFFIFWKAKALKDVYSIRDEILYQCIGFAFAITLFSISSIYFTFAYGEVKTINECRIEWLLHLPMTFIATTALAIIPTAYPVYKCKRAKLQHTLTEYVENDYIASPQSHSITSPKSQTQNEPRIKLTGGMQGMNKVLSNYNLFKAFMEYLVSEFCAENLLFVCELVQVKCAFQVRNNNLIQIPRRNIIQSEYTLIDPKNKPSLQPKSSSLQKNDNELYEVIDFNINPNNINTNKCIYTYLFHDDGSIMRLCSLTTSLLTSSIVLSEKNENKLCLQMYELYKKYIEPECNHELNISYSRRRALINYFDDNKYLQDKDYKLFNIMDDCCSEVLQLLNNPLIRYMQTEKFKQLLATDKSDNSDVIGPVGTENHVDDHTLTQMLNSQFHVIRNTTSYSLLKDQYASQQ